MTNGTRVSIAMALYNGERFVREQLESFAQQTRKPDEVVVSDDASTDRSVELVKEFSSRAPFPVRLLVNRRNGGCSKNFERAIESCTGDLIFLSDWDDVWLPNKIAIMENAFRHRPKVGIVISRHQFVDENLQPMERSEHFLLWKLLCKPWSTKEALADGRAFNYQLPVAGASAAFRARFKPLILPFPEMEEYRRSSHDTFILFAIICSGAAGVLLLPDKLMLYRRHTAAMGHYVKETSRRDWLHERFASLSTRWLPPHLIDPLIDRINGPVAERFCVNPHLRDSILRHWRARRNMPSAHLSRLPSILNELITLRYHRFSSGFLTVAQDAFFVD